MLTFKDLVKVKDMGFKYELIELQIELSQALKQALLTYIKGFYAASANTKFKG